MECHDKTHSLKLRYCGGCTKDELCKTSNGPDVPKFRLCSGCKVARYCSIEYQKAHWKFHKSDCGMPGDRREDGLGLEPSEPMASVSLLLEKWMDVYRPLIFVAAVNAWNRPHCTLPMVLCLDVSAVQNVTITTKPAKAFIVKNATTFTLDQFEYYMKNEKKKADR